MFLAKKKKRRAPADLRLFDARPRVALDSLAVLLHDDGAARYYRRWPVSRSWDPSFGESTLGHFRRPPLGTNSIFALKHSKSSCDAQTPCALPFPRSQIERSTGPTTRAAPCLDAHTRARAKAARKRRVRLSARVKPRSREEKKSTDSNCWLTWCRGCQSSTAHGVGGSGGFGGRGGIGGGLSTSGHSPRGPHPPPSAGPYSQLFSIPVPLHAPHFTRPLPPHDLQ